MTKRVFDLPQASQTRSLATQARFVDAAMRLLHARPWGEISIEDIVAEADLSVGAFYKRFRVKDDVLAACIERVLAEGRVEAEALFARGGDLAQRVSALVETLSMGWTRYGHVVRAAVAITDPSHHDALRAESAATQTRITQWLLGCRDEFAQPDPEVAVSAVFALPLAALQSATSSGMSPAQLETLRREATTMICAYLSGGDRKPVG